MNIGILCSKSALLVILLGLHPLPPQTSAAGHAELGPPPLWCEPETSLPQHPAKPAVIVDTLNRAEVVNFYSTEYLASENVPAGWTGAVSGCMPGTTSRDYIDATLRRINYFRAMSGLPANITDNAAQNVKCQDAALIMIAQGNLSHNPPSNWACYTSTGAEAAGKSNIALGAAGPTSIDLYIDDPGDFNYPIGHRRWILYPLLSSVGTGSTTAVNGYYRGSNSLWVIGNTGSRPASPEIVTWPPQGYVPWQVVYDRWSFSCNVNSSKITFRDATVSMTHNGQAVSVSVEQLSENSYGDDTIVWVPSGIPGGPPAQDLTFSVNVNGVLIDGKSRNFSYTVTVINPVHATPTPSVTKTPTPTFSPTMTPPPPVAGDLNGDGILNAIDVFLFAGCWQVEQGQAGYDARCDRDADGRITETDVALYLGLWP